jgi:hypothetical protein
LSNLSLEYLVNKETLLALVFSSQFIL